MKFPFFSRRDFLLSGAAASAGAAIPAWVKPIRVRPADTLHPSALQPFVDPLPTPPLARPVARRPHPHDPSRQLPAYHLTAREMQVQVHRDLPATRMWGLEGSFPGPTLEIESGHGAFVDWTNQLPAKHFLPIDHTLDGAAVGTPEGRVVLHLHGGRTPPESDGYPEDWTVPGQTQRCYYPCGQDAALLFYHDHSMGINRLNIYAGVQGFCIVRDAHERALNLPGGRYEIPLLLADRLLTPQGQLYYPVSDDPQKPWVPEVFGDIILVNGKALPYLDVEPRKYRFRFMNGSNGRFYRVGLSNHGEFHVIGNDQGLLSQPVAVKRLPLAPAERGDIVIDFSQMAGETLRLVSDAFDLMQFRVARQGSPDTSSLPAQLRPPLRLDESTAVRTRRLTLNEHMDDVQRSMGMLLNDTPWNAPVTEKPTLNTTEIWEIVNLTEDSHPIHLHLVRFQILDRRPFDTFAYGAKGELNYFGPAQKPDPCEAGWKDTARADPGAVTRLLIPFTGYTGRYVWHCHILEHEDNAMMRPFKVLAPETT
jgi:spore coat protein A, manganese oxidase